MSWPMLPSQTVCKMDPSFLCGDIGVTLMLPKAADGIIWDRQATRTDNPEKTFNPSARKDNPHSAFNSF